MTREIATPETLAEPNGDRSVMRAVVHYYRARRRAGTDEDTAWRDARRHLMTVQPDITEAEAGACVTRWIAWVSQMHPEWLWNGVARR